MDDQLLRLLASLATMRDELGDEAYVDAVHAARRSVAEVALSIAMRDLERTSRTQEDWKPIVNYRTIE